MDIVKIRNQINNHYKQKKEEHYKEYTKKKNEKWNKYYSSSEWHLLRTAYYTAHPLCECCLKEGIVVPCEEVHHKTRWDSGITEEAKWKLLLNPYNLASLCKHHHLLAHKYMREKQTDKADIDDIIAFEEEINRKIS